MVEVQKVLTQHMVLVESELLHEYQSLLDELLTADAEETWTCFLELWQKNDSGPVGEAARAALLPKLREKLMTFYQTAIHIKQTHKRFMRQIEKSRESIIQMKAVISAEALHCN